jgi:hypothetical protein
VKAVCVTRNFAFTFWLLGDLSNRRDGVKWDDGPNYFSDLALNLLREFVESHASEERKYRFEAELNVHCSSVSSVACSVFIH